MTLVDKIEKKCALRSEKMGYVVKPPETLFNGLGYQALNAKRYALAERYFKVNVAYYPESFNGYDYYGDYFVDKGDQENAILYFQKSLAIKETAGIREKLEALQTAKK